MKLKLLINRENIFSENCPRRGAAGQVGAWFLSVELK